MVKYYGENLLKHSFSKSSTIKSKSNQIKSNKRNVAGKIFKNRFSTKNSVDVYKC